MIASLCGIGAMYIFGFFWASSYIAYNINEALTPLSELSLPPVMNIVAESGYIVPFLFALGTGILVYRGTRKNRALILPAVGLLAFQMIYTYFFIGPDIIYERGWLYLYVLMAIIGGMTIGEIWRWIHNLLKLWAGAGAAAGYGAVIIILVLSLVLSLRGHLAEPYYHLADDARYQEFLWVREYVPSTYQTGITDIGMACPFAAVSGKYVFTGEVSPYFHIKEPAASEFLRNNAGDTTWLTGEGLSMVYTDRPVENSALEKVNDNFYLLIVDSKK